MGNQSILYRRTGKGTRTNKEPGSWHNLALISEGGQQQDSYSMVLTGLEEEAQYELRLRAMNRQGWSGLSEPFHFRTAGSYMDMGSAQWKTVDKRLWSPASAHQFPRSALCCSFATFELNERSVIKRGGFPP